MWCFEIQSKYLQLKWGRCHCIAALFLAHLEVFQNARFFNFYCVLGTAAHCSFIELTPALG